MLKMLKLEHLADGKPHANPSEYPMPAALPSSRAPTKPNVEALIENLDGNFDELTKTVKVNKLKRLIIEKKNEADSRNMQNDKKN